MAQPGDGEDMPSATIVVCEANDWMSVIHNRMPVILEQGDIAVRLSEPSEDLLRPAMSGIWIIRIPALIQRHPWAGSFPPGRTNLSKRMNIASGPCCPELAKHITCITISIMIAE